MTTDWSNHAPLSVNDPDSWAHFTFKNRVPKIIDNIISDCDVADTDARHALLRALLAQPIAEFDDGDGSTDLNDWNEALQPCIGKQMEEAPFFIAEAYLYRRIAYIMQWYTQYEDYFFTRKVESLAKAMDTWAKLSALSLDNADHISKLLHFQLWGNLADLSLKPGGNEAEVNADAVLGDMANHILADQADDAAELLRTKRGGAVHIVLDNTGLELCSDLGLTYHILANGYASQVVLHCKAQPTFVSDVIERDVWYTLQAGQSKGAEPVQDLCTRLLDMSTGAKPKLVVTSDPFWTGPGMFFDLPAHLQQQLNAASLVIFKGDANYRRLVRDLSWKDIAVLPVGDMWGQLPFATPLVAIRTLKSETAIGLSDAIVKEVSEVAPRWLVEGKYGVIQYFNKSTT